MKEIAFKGSPEEAVLTHVSLAAARRAGQEERCPPGPARVAVVHRCLLVPNCNTWLFQDKLLLLVKKKIFFFGLMVDL